MYVQKRGQSASSTAVLILLITVLIVLYILFLPPTEREQLLEGEDGADGESRGTPTSQILFTVQPGRIDYLKETSYDHHLSPIVLSVEKTAKTLLDQNSISFRSGVFDKVDRDLQFAISNLDNTENVRLQFQANKKQGSLLVYINDNIVFEGDPLDRQEVFINKNILKEENIIKFSVSSVGWKFWTTNEYQLNNVIILADEFDYAGRVSENTFSVADTEKFNLESATLFFIPQCNRETVGRLRILLNNNQIFYAKPICNVGNNVEVSADSIYSGLNKITVASEKGEYSIVDINMHNELKRLDFPTYYFEVERKLFDIEDVDEEFERVGPLKNIYEVNLILEFIGEGRKQANIFVNGHKLFMDIKDNQVKFDITRDIEESNAIKIEPKTTLDIKELSVRIKKK